jgi:group I intron endonuclease
MITNTKNGLKYIGQTKRTLAARWNSHLAASRSGKTTLLCQHLREFGAGVFTVKELESVDDSVADDVEARYITQLGTHHESAGYNTVIGGQNGPRNEAFKAYLSKRMMGNQYGAGVKRTPEHIEAIRKAHIGKPSWAKGKTFTAEHRAKIAAASSKRVLGPESRAKISVANSGLKRSPEFCANQSARQMGSQRSEETKAKMAESRRQWWEAKRQANQQFGESQ